MIGVVKPVAGQVVQRNGFSCARAALNHPGGADLGYGVVSLVLAVEDVAGCHWEYRVEPVGAVSGEREDWRPLDVMVSGPTAVANARIPAGGWRTIVIRWGRNNHWLGEIATPPVAAGELFVVAGDSPTKGQTRIEDAHTVVNNRISILDVATQKWHFANGSEPTTISPVWSALFDKLGALTRVPVGAIDVSRPATPCRAWEHGQPAFAKLRRAGEAADRFRALLWHTGLAEVESATTADEYVQTMIAIHDRLAKELSFSPPWLVGASTYCEGDVNILAQVAVRQGLQMLWKKSGFALGADLDQIDAAFRLPEDGRSVLNGAGEELAATAWLAAIWPLIVAR